MRCAYSKLLCLVALVTLILLDVSTAQRPYLRSLWTSWRVVNNKEYPTVREERLRMRIFSQNYMFSRWHNERYYLGLETYTTALNQFADLTIKEFADQYLTLRPRDEVDDFFYGRPPVGYLSPRMKVPDTVDWREKDRVTPVKDQAQCGSCWAFSATGALEGQIAKKMNKLISISEQQLVDCSTSQGNEGCNGGLMDNAFKYWKKYGAELEKDYKYSARDGRCKFNKKLVVANVTGFKDVPHGSEEQLKLSVATVGPVSVAIDASGTGFQMYSGGVYTDTTCSPDNLNHGVLAVGYSADTKGQQYWIVKNSWGQSWGHDGYILMARNKRNMCGIASMASYPTV